MKNIKVAAMAIVILLSVMIPAVKVQAATGKTTIAVSSEEIDIGEAVTVTVKVKTESGGNAKAKMELSYDEDILEFISCSVTYDGGAGGSVTATASSMSVKFKAIAEGKSPIYVEASNGVDAGSGNSLTSVEASSTNIVVNEGSAGNGGSGRLSADNSLKSLALSEGTLSPEFAGNVVNYTATVPGSVTSVEVHAETSNENASIEAIAGNTDLQVGLNTIRIVVEAENGALATYTIELTREEEEEVVASTEIENDTPPIVEDTTNEELEEALERNQYLENTYAQLEEKYQREKEFSRMVIYVLIFVIAILLVVMINIIVYYRRKMDEDFDDSFEEKKPVKKKEPKEEEPEKAESKEEKPEKTEAKEAEPEKEEAKEAEPEKTEPEKAEMKKEEPKPAEPEKAESEKAEPKEASSKKGKTPAKVNVVKDFEVFDFNDED